MLYSHSGTGGVSETTASAIRGGGRYEIFLNRRLAWHVSFDDRSVSNPAPGAESNDLLLTTGQRVNFQW